MKKLLFLALLFSACAPQMELTKSPTLSKYPPVEPYEAFALLPDSNLLQNKVYLGDIIIRDAGFTMDCDFETVVQLAAEKSRKLGGNCFVLTKHKKPGLSSSCHQIRGKVYHIDNAPQFEKTILWHPNRPLTIENFRGPTENRPFQAVTAYQIQTKVKDYTLGGKTTISVETRFICDDSYFKKSENDAQVLQHEQLHFDIAEIYGRKFRKAISEQATNYNLYRAKYEALIAAFRKELILKQDEYDSEVYKDPSLQAKWNTWVQTELAQFQDFAATEIVLGEKQRE
ncbi:MAG: hypothetical protein J0M29_19590 [Chitinophagales bacterium]|nr:hypothetical protein [Chitinophagales bacterium]